MKKSPNNQIIIIFSTLLFGCFWGVFDGILIEPITRVGLLFLLYLFLQYKLKYGFLSNNWQDKFVTLFLFCLLINFTASWINRGQNFFQSLQTDEVKQMLLILFFYLLIKNKCTIYDIEKSLVILYFLFIVCYFIQYFVFYPEPFFLMIGVNKESILNQYITEHRFRLFSQLIGFLGYFFLLNRILTERDTPFYYYWGCFLGFLFIVLLGFRVEVIAAMISSFYLIYRIKKVSIKMIGGVIVLAFAIIIAIQIPAVQKQIDNMMLRQTEGQTFQNEDYVRNIQLFYFINEHPINPLDYFFGSGIPSYSSKYGKDWYNVSTEIGSYGQRMTVGMYGWVDWGIIGLSWMTGVPMGILLYGFILFMIFRKYGKRNLYISALYLFLLLTSITTIEFYRQGAYVYHAFILYLTTLLDKQIGQRNLSL